MPEYYLHEMKFKRGSVVEVRRKDEGPFGAWFSARVISYDGYYCRVKYQNLFDSDGHSISEEISADEVRPVPPVMKGIGKLEAGDVIEVYDSHAWRLGKVVRALVNRIFAVRLLESGCERTCHLSCLRSRLFWTEGEWIQAPQVLKVPHRRPSTGLKRLTTAGKSPLTNSEIHFGKSNIINKEPAPAFDKARKRKSFSPSGVAFHDDLFKVEATTHKRRAVQNSKHQHARNGSSHPPLEKVDTFPFPKNNVGEECMSVSSSEDRLKQTTEEADSSQSSVGSTSSSYVSNGLLLSVKKYSHHSLVHSAVDDAESICECPKSSDESLAKEEVAKKVHKLELRAYRSTLRAFYLSGSLTWEKETLLSNLRYELNISNDEHLSELKCLQSAKSLVN